MEYREILIALKLREGTYSEHLYRLLHEADGDVIGKSELVHSLWPNTVPSYPDSEFGKVLRNVRDKIRKADIQDAGVIRNIKGIGYYLDHLTTE